MEKGKRVKKSDKKVWRIVGISAAAVVAVVLLAMVGMGIYVANRDTIFPNVTVYGIDVGGMTYDKAHSTLLNSVSVIPEKVEATVVLTDDVSITVTSDMAGLAGSVSDAVSAAFNYGRDGGFVSNLFTYIGCLTKQHDIINEKVFDEASVRSMIASAALRADHSALDSGYSVTADELVITKGSDGYTVDQQAVYDYIHDTLVSGVSASTDMFSEAMTSGDGKNEIDIDEIYNEVFTEPRNAVYDPKTQGATKAEDGVSFDLDAAKREYATAAPGDTVRIPLVKTPAEITTDGLMEMIFRDKLSEKMTTMYTSSSYRITNITLAAEAINGLVLNPGDEFSFNGTVGERTAAKGYKPAGAYVGGESVDQIGGGICQVSSTIYYCVLMANLEVTHRQNHMYSVAYLPLGFDATVNWGTIDFKFKNDKDYPIKIVCYVENKELYVELWGTKTDDTYVELQSYVVDTLDYETIEKEDETLAPGETQVKTAGHGGYISEAYKLLYDGDGNLISKTFLSKDTYRAQNRVVLVGPEPTEPAGPTEPEEPDNPDEPDYPEEPEDPGEMGDPNETGDPDGSGESGDTGGSAGSDDGDEPAAGTTEGSAEPTAE